MGWFAVLPLRLANINRKIFKSSYNLRSSLSSYSCS